MQSAAIVFVIVPSIAKDGNGINDAAPSSPVAFMKFLLVLFIEFLDDETFVFSNTKYGNLLQILLFSVHCRYCNEVKRTKVYDSTYII